MRRGSTLTHLTLNTYEEHNVVCDAAAGTNDAPHRVYSGCLHLLRVGHALSLQLQHCRFKAPYLGPLCSQLQAGTALFISDGLTGSAGRTDLGSMAREDCE